MAVELDIIRLFDSNLRGFYTINTISQKLGKAYPFIHRKVHALLNVGVLRKVTVGGSLCISVNLQSRRAVLYLTELELEKRAKLPDALQKVAKQLETDGTLAIETAVYGNGQIYVVGNGSYPGAKTVSAEEFKELLLTTSLFSEHAVLHGYERFFTYLSSLQSELDSAYNPLVAVKA
jgi:hypothetical protein